MAGWIKIAPISWAREVIEHTVIPVIIAAGCSFNPHYIPNTPLPAPYSGGSSTSSGGSGSGTSSPAGGQASGYGGSSYTPPPPDTDSGTPGDPITEDGQFDWGPQGPPQEE